MISSYAGAEEEAGVDLEASLSTFLCSPPFDCSCGSTIRESKKKGHRGRVGTSWNLSQAAVGYERLLMLKTGSRGITGCTHA